MRLSLARLFVGAALASSLIVAGALALFWQNSRQAALAAAERSRRSEAARVEAQVARALGVARDVLENVRRALESGAVDAASERAVEALAYTELLGARHLAEVTFTVATPLAASVEPLFSEPGHWQLSVFRTAEGEIATRRTRRQGAKGFVARERRRAAHSARFEPDTAELEAAASDPTAHPTFEVSVALGPAGDAIWSDLHYSELDGGSARRVVLTVQRAAWQGERLLGVVRVGLLTTDLDAITDSSPPDAVSAGARIALLAVGADARARLVARISPADGVRAFGEELRIVPARPPAELAALLDSPLLIGLDAACPSREGRLRIGAEDWLATLSPLSIAEGGTAGWLVAVLVPESAYTRELVALGRVLALVFGAASAIVLTVGAGVLASVRRGLTQLGETAAHMRDFDFAPSEPASVLTEIDELLGSLERAKTVGRALCKYVPVPLVRRLYERNVDPELGGEPRELTLLFTDIQGFTTLSEQLPASELAHRLGLYFQVLTQALEAHGATLDKYIGDAVMAFWNAPEPLERHAESACAGVLAARAALVKLYASPAWQGAAPLVTRFGLHRTRALVGHFGAPTRLAYTALGDGVNLAARLESLCKHYGLTALVSASVAHAAPACVFRHVDRVIVQGKSEPTDIYELLVPAPLGAEGNPGVQAYAAALAAYFRRDFAAARVAFEHLSVCDPASRVLARRCERFERDPPPPDWNGAHAAEGK